jgi:hypothetical protein
MDLAGGHPIQPPRSSEGAAAMATPPAICAHLQSITHIMLPDIPECDECVKIGSDWVHLRTCQTCGVTRCCDSSPRRHASAHAHDSGHPVIASAEPGERWLYCYPDKSFAAY